MAYYPTNYRYDKENRVKVGVSLNRKTEPELTEWVTSKDKPSTYLKELARRDMERAKKEEEENK